MFAWFAYPNQLLFSARVLQLQKTQADGFNTMKRLLAPKQSTPLEVSFHSPVANQQSKAVEGNSNETSYDLIVGTLLWITSARVGDPTRIKFTPAYWTCLSRGYELLYKKVFGGPQFLFRHFNTITREHPAWKACVYGDLHELQRLFSDGLATPYDLTDDGANFLYVCLPHWMPACKLKKLRSPLRSTVRKSANSS